MLRLNPKWGGLMNRLAWLLATNKEAKYHNPDEAIQLAERACEPSDYKLPEVLDTLAIAYSAAGRFPEAIETAERVVKLAEAAGKKNLSLEIQERLELYKAGLPYHEK